MKDVFLVGAYVVLALCLVHCAAVSIPAAEVAALDDLYNRCGGANWTSSSGW